jgi:hypothetical protein
MKTTVLFPFGWKNFIPGVIPRQFPALFFFPVLW